MAQPGDRRAAARALPRGHEADERGDRGAASASTRSTRSRCCTSSARSPLPERGCCPAAGGSMLREDGTCGPSLIPARASRRSFALVSPASSLLERPGLGLGHLFYVPIVLAAFASGPVLGGLAGVLATRPLQPRDPHQPAHPVDAPTRADGDPADHLHRDRRAVGFFVRRNRSLLGAAVAARRS